HRRRLLGAAGSPPIGAGRPPACNARMPGARAPGTVPRPSSTPSGDGERTDDVVIDRALAAHAVQERGGEGPVAPVIHPDRIHGAAGPVGPGPGSNILTGAQAGRELLAHLGGDGVPHGLVEGRRGPVSEQGSQGTAPADEQLAPLPPWASGERPPAARGPGIG